MIEITIPHINGNRIAWRGVLSPQLSRRKTNCIQVLRWLAQKMRILIREYEDAVVTHDSAFFASRVSRQASVSHWIYIPGADLLSHFEASLGVSFRSHKIAAQPGHCRHCVGGKRRSFLLRSRRGLAAFHLLPRHQARL